MLPQRPVLFPATTTRRRGLASQGAPAEELHRAGSRPGRACRPWPTRSSSSLAGGRALRPRSPPSSTAPTISRGGRGRAPPGRPQAGRAHGPLPPGGVQGRRESRTGSSSRRPTGASAPVDSFLLQEIVPGATSEIYIAGGYHDAQSRCLALFTGRKLRQHPRGFGVARLCETRWSNRRWQSSRKMLAEVTTRDLRRRVQARSARRAFQVHGDQRAPGFLTALARAAGVNLSYVAFRDAIGRPCQQCRQRDGVRWIDLLRDGPDSLRELRRGELNLREWLAPLLGVRADAYLSLHDPATRALRDPAVGRPLGQTRVSRVRAGRGSDGLCDDPLAPTRRDDAGAPEGSPQVPLRAGRGPGRGRARRT